MRQTLLMPILVAGQLLFLASLSLQSVGVQGFTPSSQLRRPTSSFSSVSSKFRFRASSDGNDNNDGNNDGTDKPSMDNSLSSDWEDSKKPQDDDEGIIDSIKSWIRSDEGKEDIQTYFVSLFIALILRFTIIEPRYIPSLSMFPTFEVGDQLAVEKVTKRLKPFYRNEVVVFNPPETFREIIGDSRKGREALIKRIVAVQGDQVEVKGGKLYINGARADEPFTAEDAKYEFGPVVVPKDCVLVLGDNRNQSLDGHIWGFLPKENVIGRAVFVYWPPWRVGNGGLY